MPFSQLWKPLASDAAWTVAAPPIFDGAMDISGLLDSYDLHRSVDFTTLRQMQFAARSFTEHAGSSDIKNFRQDPVNRWIRDLTRDGKSPSTVRTYRSAILTLWRFAVTVGLLHDLPSGIRSVRVPYKNAVAFSPDECASLLSAAESLEGSMPWSDGVERRLFWGAIIRVSWDSSLRRGDLLDGIYPDKSGLKWADISDGTDGCGKLHRAQNKTGHSVEAILSPGTMAALGNLPQFGDAVFPWPRSVRAFIGQFERIRERANVRRLPWKAIRRSSITSVAMRDISAAARQAGHAPGSPVTIRNYVDWSQVSTHRERPEPLDGRLNPRR